jgi:hypothetical protein
MPGAALVTGQPLFLLATLGIMTFEVARAAQATAATAIQQSPVAYGMRASPWRPGNFRPLYLLPRVRVDAALSVV